MFNGKSPRVRHGRTVEIAIYGRGGQGQKTAGDVLTYALYQQGFKPHGQPRYSADRMGAPVYYAIRFNTDGSPTLDRSWIKNPEIVVLSDLTLIEQLDLVPAWRQGITVIVNTRRSAEELQALGDFHFATLDANRIAKECHLMKGSVPILSSVMAGAFARVTELITAQQLLQAMTDLAAGTAMGRYLAPNLEAARRGWQEVKSADPASWRVGELMSW